MPDDTSESARPRPRRPVRREPQAWEIRVDLRNPFVVTVHDFRFEVRALEPCDLVQFKELTGPAPADRGESPMIFEDLDGECVPLPCIRPDGGDRVPDGKQYFTLHQAARHW